DRDGSRHEPLVPLRPDLSDVPRPGHAVRLRGRERRRLGALRGAGEGAAARGLADARVRARLGPPAAAPIGNAVLLPDQRPVAIRTPPAVRSGLAAGTWAVRGQAHSGRERARGPAGMAA